MALEGVLQKVKSEIGSAPRATTELWTYFAPELQQNGWSCAQLSLWLSCTPTIECSEQDGGEAVWSLKSGQAQISLSIADELVALLHKASRPMPLAQLVNKLPAGFVVTEPMVRAAAQQDERLELLGPLLKLSNGNAKR